MRAAGSPLPAMPTCALHVPSARKLSSPGESHPQALPEPDVNLSAHPAPIVQPMPQRLQCGNKAG